MAIDLQNAYIQKAHRISDHYVDASVTEVQAGQLFQLNDQGKWVYADGTKRAYPTVNERFAGKGLGPQGERLEGRDDVSRSGKLSVLGGNFVITTDQYDHAATFKTGDAVTAGAGGKIVPYNAADNKPHLIRGYVMKAPTPENPWLRYEG